MWFKIRNSFIRGIYKLRDINPARGVLRANPPRHSNFVATSNSGVDLPLSFPFSFQKRSFCYRSSSMALFVLHLLRQPVTHSINYLSFRGPISFFSHKTYRYSSSSANSKNYDMCFLTLPFVFICTVVVWCMVLYVCISDYFLCKLPKLFYKNRT